MASTTAVIQTVLLSAAIYCILLLSLSFVMLVMIHATSLYLMLSVALFLNTPVSVTHAAVIVVSAFPHTDNVKNDQTAVDRRIQKRLASMKSVDDFYQLGGPHVNSGSYDLMKRFLALQEMGSLPSNNNNNNNNNHNNNSSSNNKERALPTFSALPPQDWDNDSASTFVPEDDTQLAFCSSSSSNSSNATLEIEHIENTTLAWDLPPKEWLPEY